MSGGFTIERPIVDHRAKWPVDWFKRILLTWWIGRGHRSETFFYFQYSACNTPSQLKTDLGRDSSAFTLQLKSELKDHSFWFVLHDNIFSSPIPKRLPDWPVRFCPNSFDEIFLKKSLFSSFCLKSWDEFDILVRIFRENIRRFSWAVVDNKSIFEKL